MEIHQFYISKMQRRSKYLVPGDSHINILVHSVCIQRTVLQWMLCFLHPFNVCYNNVLSLKNGYYLYVLKQGYIYWIYIYLQDII